ncbi:hypothetical protein OIU85_005075 [Salix viminalis]|uniref:C2 domain-containing protein n=1 Tax=Salix viminalis TaxID=40686 RepID=A0A9Q0SY37_SALVM|nr:hypothetical protein OIU85_005075 [Salix viminalis]
MERRPLDITVASGKGLKDVNLIGKMDVYCVVSIKGDPHKSKQKQKTKVHQDCGPNPVWNYPMKFTIDEAAAQQNRLQIKFKLLAERMMGDKDVGVVSVPVKELLDSKDGKGGLVSYAVKTPSGKMKGTLSFSYNLGEKFNAPAPEKAKEDGRLRLPTASASSSASGSLSLSLSVSSTTLNKAMGGYPPAPGHGYQGYPPQPGYGGYPQQPGYGGYPPAMQQQKPKKSGKGNMALGLGAGLLGGLLVGEMISDVGDAAFL